MASLLRSLPVLLRTACYSSTPRNLSERSHLRYIRFPYSPRPRNWLVPSLLYFTQRVGFHNVYAFLMQLNRLSSRVSLVMKWECGLRQCLQSSWAALIDFSGNDVLIFTATLNICRTGARHSVECRSHFPWRILSDALLQGAYGLSFHTLPRARASIFVFHSNG
jgi:hypothetical protein